MASPQMSSGAPIIGRSVGSSRCGPINRPRSRSEWSSTRSPKYASGTIPTFTRISFERNCPTAPDPGNLCFARRSEGRLSQPAEEDFPKLGLLGLPDAGEDRLRDMFPLRVRRLVSGRHRVVRREPLQCRPLDEDRLAFPDDFVFESYDKSIPGDEGEPIVFL